MNTLPTRQALMSMLPVGTVGAELGVFEGRFCLEIMRAAKPRLLYAVDLWSVPYEIQYTHSDHVRLSGPDAWRATRARLHEYIVKGKAQLVCADAIQWLRSMPRHSLDWVYLDDEHTLEQVSAELSESLRVVRPQGLIMGHDYCELLPGVVQAVDEFCERTGLAIETLTQEPPQRVHPEWRELPPACHFRTFAIRV